MKKKTKQIISYISFIIAFILGVLIIFAWLFFSALPPYDHHNGGCHRLYTKDVSQATKYHHYRFDKCRSHKGWAVNVSMYDLQSNTRVYSKTVLAYFEDLGFIRGSLINCGLRSDSSGIVFGYLDSANSEYFEACDIPMSYTNWYGAYREFSVTTPRYYLKPPHFRDQE